jgi:hypothetical protein
MSGMQNEKKNEETAVVLKAVTGAVKKAVSEAMTEQKRQERQKALYNTRKLMESYIEMQTFLHNAISEEREVQNTAFFVFGGENAKLDSIRKSKMKTAMMIANIDRAMEELKREHEQKGTAYKFEAFRMHYVDGIAYEEITETLNCGKNSPSAWSKLILKQMSVKLFGINGIDRF